MDPGAPVAASKLQPVTVTALRLANSQAAVATRVRATGLELSAGMSFDEWAILGHRIARVHSGSAWALGDWLLYGERSFGDRYRSAVDATNLDYQTLRNYAWVARSFESARRREGLSFQHHAEVAALSETEQDLWLHRAETERWSRNELRRRLGVHRMARTAAGEPEPVIVRVEVPSDAAERWREAAAVARQDVAEWLRSVADAAAEASRRVAA